MLEGAFALALKSPPPWFLNIMRDHHFAIRADGALNFSAMLLMHRCFRRRSRCDSQIRLAFHHPTCAADRRCILLCQDVFKIHPTYHELTFYIDNKSTVRQMHISDQHKDKIGYNCARYMRDIKQLLLVK